MKFAKSIIVTSFAVQSANAFSTPRNNNNNNNIPRSTTSQTSIVETTRIQFLQQAFTAAGILTFIPQPSSASSSGDPFALPSYSDAVSNKAIDMKLEDVNKKILDDAAARRDDRNVDKENNQRFIQLKQEEAEEEKRLERMKELAKREREERIAREKEETKANRWNTF